MITGVSLNVSSSSHSAIKKMVPKPKYSPHYHPRSQNNNHLLKRLRRDCVMMKRKRVSKD